MNNDLGEKLFSSCSLFVELTQCVIMLVELSLQHLVRGTVLSKVA